MTLKKSGFGSTSRIIRYQTANTTPEYLLIPFKFQSDFLLNLRFLFYFIGQKRTTILMKWMKKTPYTRQGTLEVHTAINMSI